MTYRNSPNRVQMQTVPLHVAQRIEAERDALVEEVRRLQKVDHTSDDLTGAEDVENQRLIELEGQVHDLTIQNLKLSDELAASTSESIIKQLSRRIQELESDLSRSLRRAETEVDAGRRDQRGKLLSGLGEVLDSTDLALRMNPSEGPWREGLSAIRGQLVRFITSNGAKLTGEVGTALDPHLHEAIAVVESPYPRGQIAEVHRLGIILEDGAVARTALVAVAA